MMDTSYLEMLTSKLHMRGVNFAPGLSDIEVAQVEAIYGFHFPPDLKSFLQYLLPVSGGWLNWREYSEAAIRERLNWPLEGMLFDIEHNTFWRDDWGPKPDSLTAAFAIARDAVAQASRIIPIFAHRYIPEEPHLAGNPIFSVYQTDIIYYGYDLASYFANEFHVDKDTLSSYYLPTPEWTATSPRPIRFWGDIVS